MGNSSQPQYSQEIRYAVVMYGGISLAIYMIDRYFETLAEVIRCDLRGVHDEREILATEEN